MWKGFALLLFVCLLDAGISLNEVCKPREEGKRSSCTKSCARENCKSARKECLCDGECGLSCINKNLRCINLGRTIPNGRVDIVPFNKFGAVAKYRCKDGYELKGMAVRVCQGNEEWSGEEPKCVLSSVPEKAECGPPPYVANAVHRPNRANNSYPLGTMLEYTCIEGFHKGKDDAIRAWCVGVGWVGPRMKCHTAGCPKPDPIENGGIRDPFHNAIGAIMTYYCMPGFHLAGRSTRECQPSGQWDGHEPSCEKVTCGAPPVIENAVHDGPRQPRYSAGKQLTYKCNMGYFRQYDPRIMCGSDGEWTRLEIRCQPVNCGFPGELENGWRSGHIFHYPESVQYQCHDGYELRGSSNRTCQANAEWSGMPPICEAVDCPTLVSPRNGRKIGVGNAYGTVIRFECDDDFHLSGSVERRCRSDRSWSGTETRCLEIDCGLPTNFWNGYILGEKTTVGATLFFSCHVRTKFVGNSFDAVCLKNGSWSNPPPTCWGQCQVPSSDKALLEGAKEGTWKDHGARLRYDCGEGFVPAGSQWVECYNGTWSAMPECVPGKPAPCPGIPPAIANGLRIYTGRQHGRKAKYICLNGFSLAGMDGGHSTLTCLHGRWVGGTPRCEQVFCQNPGTIENGKVLKLEKNNIKFEFKTYITEISHGQRLGFECAPGYTLKGHSGATCINGTWSPPLGAADSHCVEALHLPFPPQWQPVEGVNYHV